MIDFEVISINDFQRLNSDEQKKYIEKMKKVIGKSNNEILKKMNNIVKRNVKSFVSDFYVHDVYMLKKYEEPFLWMTRSTGTDFIPLGNLDKSLIAWYHCIKTINKNFYYYNGKSLKKINIEEAEKIIEKYKKD